jgi:hypothetical protein
VIIFLVQLFWLSFPVIGLGALLACTVLKPRARFSKQLAELAKNGHLLTVVFLLFCVGVGLFAPLLVLAYTFKLPVDLVVGYYLALLSIGVGMITASRQKLRTYLTHRLTGTTRNQRLLAILVIIVVIVEYVVALRTGAAFYDDTPVHLAKLQLQLNAGHFTFADPYLGQHGVVDLRYMVNTLGSMQVVAARLFGVMAYQIWFYSHAFHCLLLSVSLFALAHTYLPKSVRNWSYAVLLLNPIYSPNGAYFYIYPELPHAVALVWTCLLFIGLKHLFEKSQWQLVVLASFLIATTHALASCYTAAFLLLLGGCLLALRRLNRKQATVLAVCIAMLLVPVAITQALPKGGVQPELHFTSGRGLHLRGVSVKDVGIFKVPAFALGSKDYYLIAPIFDARALVVSVVMVGYIMLFKQIKRQRAKQVLIWALLAVALGSYNVLYVSLIGYAFLIRRASSTHARVIVATATLFFACIAFNPLVLTVAYGHFPLWFIARFQDLNMFAMIAPIIAIPVGFRFVARYWGIADSAQGLPMFIVFVVMVFLPYPHSPFHPLRVLTSSPPGIVENNADYAAMGQLRDLDPYLRNQSIFTADAATEYRAAITTTGAKQQVLLNPQANQMQNIVLRAKCDDDIIASLSLRDLQSAGITRVVIRIGKYAEHDRRPLIELAASRPYLKLVATVRDYQIYSVPVSTTPFIHSPNCTIPYGE